MPPRRARAAKGSKASKVAKVVEDVVDVVKAVEEAAAANDMKEKDKKKKKSRSCLSLGFGYFVSSRDDVEKTAEGPSHRPMRMLAPFYSGVAVALSICTSFVQSLTQI